jgi:hypothetical protein
MEGVRAKRFVESSKVDTSGVSREESRIEPSSKRNCLE